MINRFRRLLVLGMAAAASLAATQALAQSDAQRNAIKSACRSDYMSKCASVPPGGTAAFQCLQKNIASLSSACQTAVKALEPAAEARPPAEAKPVVEAKPASAPPAASAPVAAEASRPSAEPPKAAAQPAVPVQAIPAPPVSAAAKPAASAPAGKPSEAQVAAIRTACGSDYRKVCSSVPPGGAAALQCLEQNKVRVSGPCAQAMASSSGGVTPSGASTATAAVARPAATTPAAPAAPALVLRPLRPLEELRIVRAACGADARALCSGIEPGGGRIAQCLAANAGALTPGCKGMLAQFAANR
ncbi:cysteine rich repeat-containing protein [Bradyrhizobium sp. SZCCHNR1015]|uniref:cysteine rich repeat-containing protein n=1 Tax=Bradyrhizobium sp. SZCCHNR1015 TaxID=3057338 RepID=UPI00291607CE|nr:cysteine rich repeat-containing protein [Bradyrhizobium sp. SZCCHNR1015]